MTEAAPASHTERWQVAGFGLYVHWPFCQSKCPYCDFNSHVAGTVDQDAWGEAFVAEIRRAAELTNGRVLSSIFFGGGTPSLMSASLVDKIVRAATDFWAPANDIEITLEANPTSVEIDRFRGIRAAGVNRVSIGVQALNDTDLRRLGRMHDTTEALRAIKTAESVFDRFSFDLIYGRQEQSAASWERELTQALDLGARHISLYQLTIEPETVFGERFRRGQLRGLPDEDLGADLYAMTQGICEAAGLPAYEISNHSAPGEASRHNLIYWKSGDFIGIGPGAHGRVTLSDGARLTTEAPKDPNEWLRLVHSGAPGSASSAPLSDLEKAEEYLVMGLRLSAGIDTEDLARFTGHRITPKSLSEMIRDQLIVVDSKSTTISMTPEGRILLNSVLSKLELERI